MAQDNFDYDAMGDELSNYFGEILADFAREGTQGLQQQLPGLSDEVVRTTHPSFEAYALLSVLFSVVAADEILALGEMKFLEKLFPNIDVAKFAEHFERQPIRIERILDSLSTRQRLIVFNLAWECALADGNFHENEIAYLKDLKKQFGIGNEALTNYRLTLYRGLNG